MTMEEGIKELEARRAKAEQMGGAERIAKQHARGRLTARERVEKLLDPGSFFEFGLLAQANIPELESLSAADGRICGTGTINGRKVAVIAQDRTILGGSGGTVGHRKTDTQRELALEGGYPVIELADEAGGVRIQDVMGSREWLGEPTKIMVWVQAQNLVTVPRIHILIRKYYAMGVMCMQGNIKRTDIIAAWPTARLSFVDPEIGLELAMESRIKEAKNPEAEKQRVREEWMASSSPWGAAGVYGLHDVIDPRDTRKFIFRTLEMLRGNREKVIGEHRLQDWPTGF